jgi:hypothetical protein
MSNPTWRIFSKPDTYYVVAYSETDSVNGRQVNIRLIGKLNDDTYLGLQLSRELAIRLRNQLNEALEG